MKVLAPETALTSQHLAELAVLPGLEPLEICCRDLTQFRSARGPQWRGAELWCMPGNATAEDKETFKVLCRATRAAELRFWHSLLSEKLNEQARAMYLFSALCAPDLYMNYEQPSDSAPVGKWDYVDMAFTPRKTPRISPMAREEMARCNVKNAHLIPASFQFGDTGWNNEEQALRYGYYLKHAVKEARLLGAVISGGWDGRRADDVLPESVRSCSSYDVIFMNYPYSGQSALILAGKLLAPGGYLITRRGVQAEGEQFTPLIKERELFFTAYCKR